MQLPMTPITSAISAGPWDHRTGSYVSHYHVLSRIGGGAQGVVYLARDTELNRLVALKFWLPVDDRDEDAMGRFVREARAAAAAMHPHICAIHGIESAPDGQVFIVMAYCGGQTLKQVLQGGRLDPREAVEFAAQIAEALAAAHAEGVVHRDIKPSNLMLTANGVSILDFGCAQYTDWSRTSASGELVGTAAYMSPEQSRGEEVDARTDVWSTGIVLYEMLAGTAPFEGSHPEALVHAIRHDAPRPLSHFVQGIPWELETLVMAALRKDLRERVQTASDLANGLRRIQQIAWTRQPTRLARALTFLKQSRSRLMDSVPARPSR